MDVGNVGASTDSGEVDGVQASSHVGSRAASDAQLLAAYQEGEQRAFDDLVSRYASMVHGVCLRVLGDHDLAQDASQSVFLLLIRKAKGLSPRVNLGGWLHLTARTSALQMRRNLAVRARHARDIAAVSRPTGGDAHDAFARAESLADLDRALGTLPAAQREAVIARFCLGLSQTEAAVHLGCPEETVHTRVRRAMDRLRRQLGQLGAAAVPGLLAPGPGPCDAMAERIASAVRHPGDLPHRVTSVAAAVERSAALGRLVPLVMVAVIALAAFAIASAIGSSRSATAPRRVVDDIEVAAVRLPSDAPVAKPVDVLAGWTFIDLIGEATEVVRDGRRMTVLRVKTVGKDRFGRASYRLPAISSRISCAFDVMIEERFQFPRLFAIGIATSDSPPDLPALRDYPDEAYRQDTADLTWFAMRLSAARPSAGWGGPWALESWRNDGRAWSTQSFGVPQALTITMVNASLLISDCRVEIDGQVSAPASEGPAR